MSFDFNMKTWILVFKAIFVIYCMIGTISGAKIVFETSRDAVNASLTPPLKMRCSLIDTATSSVSAVIGRRDVTVTSEDVRHVTTLVIMRNDNEHVASVSQYDPAKAYVDSQGLTVSGDVNGLAGERGYLELVWKYPTPSLAGQYTCEVNSISKFAHTVVHSKSLEVGANSPTFTDLINNDRDIYMKLDQLMAMCSKPKHVEQGIVSCGDSATWTGHMDNGVQRYRNVTVPFSKSYDQLPAVHLSLTDFASDGRLTTDFHIKVVNVSEDAFTLQCIIYRGLHSWDQWVTWISL